MRDLFSSSDEDGSDADAGSKICIEDLSTDFSEDGSMLREESSLQGSEPFLAGYLQPNAGSVSEDSEVPPPTLASTHRRVTCARCCFGTLP
jgi:hypothetical protein